MNDSLLDNLATLAQVAPTLEAHGIHIISATADSKAATFHILGDIGDARKIGAQWTVDAGFDGFYHLSHLLDGARIVIVINLNTRDLYRRDDIIDLSLYDGGAA